MKRQVLYYNTTLAWAASCSQSFRVPTQTETQHHAQARNWKLKLDPTIKKIRTQLKIRKRRLSSFQTHPHSRLRKPITLLQGSMREFEPLTLILIQESFKPTVSVLNFLSKKLTCLTFTYIQKAVPFIFYLDLQTPHLYLLQEKKNR